MVEPRVTWLQAIILFDNKLVDKILRASIKAKPYLEVMPNKKPAKSYILNLKKTNTNLKAKIQQDTNKSNNLKQEIKQL